MREKTGVISLLLLPIVLSTLGARLETPILGLTSIVVVCIIVGLVAFGKIGKKWYPWTLFAIALSLLWQTSLLSNYLIGTDIHIEYYYFQLANANGWDPTLLHSYNTSVVLTLLAPFLSKALHIEGYWVFKVIFPLLFTLTPMILYFAFSELMEKKRAFLSSFFFLSFPAFTLEGVSHAKFMLSGPFFALLILLAVKTSMNWKLRVLLAIVCSLAVGACYYSHGYALLIYLVTGLGILGVIKLIPWLRCKVSFSFLGYLVSIVLIIGIVCGYFAIVGEGGLLRTLIYYGRQHIFTYDRSGTEEIYELEDVRARWQEDIEQQELNPNWTVEDSKLTEIERNAIEYQLAEPPWTVGGLKATPLLAGNTPPPGARESLVRAALGLDLLEVSWPGRLFRVVQISTEILIVIGGAYVFIKRKKYQESFVVFVCVSLLLLLACLVKPGFISLFGAPKLYLITLFLLAPLVITGGEVLFKRRALSILSLGLLIPYFLLTSGFAFEVFKVPDIATFEVPYSAGLSSYRVDISGTFTRNDKYASDWIQTNLPEDTCIFADLHGMELLYDWGTTIDNLIYCFPQNWLPQDLGMVPDTSWIFLREWNERSREITYWANTGLRKSFTYEERELPRVLEGRNVIYRSGDAVVYGAK